MASSDDEGEALPDTVSNYYFVNDKDEPISFSELPVQWNENEGLDGKRQQIFLHGTTDNGLQKIYKQVTAWKFDLSDAKPEVMVLSKDNNWIKLQKPRKSFEDTIRTILITVHCLHLAKKNPEISERSLWDHLSKVFSLYETKPRRNDLIDHMKLIGEAVKVDEVLAKSKFLVTFLEEKPQKEVLDEDIGSTTKDWFFVDDDMIDEIEDDGSDEDEDLFDSVCAICDNGGDILCCEGRCMRSFHATKEAGSESGCVSLGLSNEQVEAIQNFFCKNCQYKQHQCFACGELGSSDKLSGTEVYKCVSATCGHFYHPHCVAKLLHRENAAEAEELQKKIAAGESFTCPIHKCIACKQGENKMDPDLQFAVCRRCPKSYHRKCLPRKIVFEGEDEGIIERAWEGLIPNRILIYCLKHEIDDELRTPVRNHIKFPDDGKKRKKLASEQLSSKEKVLRKERNLTAEDVPRKRILGKVQEDVDWSSIFKEDDSSKKIARRSIGPESSKMQKAGDKSRKPLNNAASRKLTKSTADEKKPSLGEMLYNFMSKGSESVKSKKDDGPDSEHKQPQTEKSVAKAVSNSLPLDDDSKKRILALVKDASSSITLEKIIEKHKLPTTHAYSSKNVVDRTITLGKVEGSVEAVRAALKKIEEGSSIEDAKAVCEPEVLNQLIKWKNKLKVYLAPFLYGMRYTSFGRHFTKVDKLKEIVDRLHYYVQDGDMIVDFCCGANDFSWLMKQKLDEIGTRCSYKNYDVLQAKNDFNFEKRDWFSVYPKELPTGSQLIMGLNPPFGVNAALANKFIDKALEFKPKLVILIVPEETERLDKKVPPYDLVWEDDELLSGKSFYLPGSVDVNDNQLEDWNVNTPPLYLWSRSDWTGKHKAIAQQHGHLSRVREQSHLEAPCETPISNNPIDVHDRDDQTSKSVDDPLQNAHERLKERGASVAERKKKDVPSINGHREVNESRRHDKNHPETSKKRRRGKGKRGIGSGEKTSTAGKEKGRSSANEMNERMPLHSPPNVTSGRSMDSRSFEPIEAPSHSNEGHRRFEPSVSRSRSHFETGCDESHQTDDIARRFSLNVVEPYSGGNHGWSSGPTTDYGVRNSEERFPGYQSTDARGYRAPYISEMDERHVRESALRSQVPVYGQQPYSDTFNQRSGYFPVGEPGFSSSYNQMGPAADSSYSRMNTSSTMQRYAPRLDELNHTRMNTYRTEPPLASRNVIPDPFATPPGYRVDSLGFAPGPSRPYSQQNSSGWLNE